MAVRKRPSKKAKSGYTYQVYFDYKDKYGITGSYVKGGFATKKSAENHEILKRSELITDGKLININEISVDQVWEIYQKTARISRNTLLKYKNRYKNWIGPYFGEMKINRLDNIICQKKFDTFTTQKRGSKEILLQLINNLLLYAYENELIPKERKIKINLGENDASVIEAVDENVLLDYIDYLSNGNNKNKKQLILALWIGYYTGMRKGEIFALDVNDIDLVNSVMHINKTLIYDHEKKELYISSTKTTKSTGTIPIVPQLKVILSDYLRHHAYPILLSSDGNYISPNAISTNMHYYSKKHGVHIHFHQLRHSMATRLCEADINPKIAQEILRHKKIETTLGVYTNIKKDIVEKTMSDVFSTVDLSPKPVKNLSKTISDSTLN